MPYNTELYDLIQSLNRTEKAYFKKFAYKKDSAKSNPYLQLFDAIDKQKEYDEDKLLKKFRNERFAKQFSVAKNYLLNLIASSLADYDTQKTPRNRLLQLMREIRALKERGAIELAKKRIESAIKLAEKYGDDWILYNLYTSYLILLPLQDSDSRHQLYQTIQEKIDSLQNLEAFRKLYGELLRLTNEGISVREGESEQGWHQLVGHPLLQDYDKALNFTTRYQFHEIWLNYHIRLNQSQKIYDRIKQLVQLFDDAPTAIEQKPSIYLMTINNLMFIEAELGKTEELQKTITLIQQKRKEKVLASVEQTSPHIFYTLEVTLLAYYIETKAYQKAYEIIPPIRACLDKIFALEKDRAFRAQYNIALALFYLGKYGEALEEVNDLLMKKELDKKSPDIGAFTRILDLIIHFELDNDLLIEYTSRSAYRYLYRNKRLYKLENVLLTFFKRLSKINDASSLQSAFADLKVELVRLKKEPYESDAFRYFHFLDWVESKLEGKGFSRVVDNL